MHSVGSDGVGEAPSSPGGQMDTKQQVHFLWLEILASGADKGFRSLDQFANWFIGGTAAVFAFLIGNLDRVPGLEPNEVRAMLPLIIVAFALILLAKFLGSLICPKAGALERIVALLEAKASRDEPIPTPEEFLAEQAVVLPWPLRLATTAFSSEPANQARRVMWSLLVAGLSTLSAAGFVIAAWIKLAAAL